MYAGTNYGSFMAHPIAGYNSVHNPSALGFNGLGFGPAALPAAAAAGPAAPFVAAALIAAPFVAKLLSNMAKGCGQSCVLTSQAANEVEVLLKDNLRMYQQSGHTKSEQKAALDYFDLVWGQLRDSCGQPEFQRTKAGRNCVEDRQAGACKWRGDDGQCWNWFIGYRDPIANDVNVRPEPVGPVSGNGSENAIEDAGQSLLSAFDFEGKDSSALLLIIGAAAVVYLAS